MNKWLLILSFGMIGFSGWAQQAVASASDATEANPAVNISLSGTGLSAGDEFYEEASKQAQRGELNDALTDYGKAAFEYNNSKQLSKYANALLRMGDVHMLLRNYLEAEQVVLNVALRTYAKLGNKSGQMASYASLGRIYLASGKLTQSMWFYTQQGILARQLGNNSSHIESVIGIANVKIKKKEFKMASRDLNSAEFLAKAYKISFFDQQIKNARSLIDQGQKG